MDNLLFNSEADSAMKYYVDKYPQHLHQVTISDKNVKIDNIHDDSLTPLDTELTISRFTSINEVYHPEKITQIQR